MASTSTKDLRLDIVARLRAWSPLSSVARVDDSRATPYPLEELPAVNVQTSRDRDEMRSSGIPVFRRVLEVEINCHATGDTDEDAQAAADDLEIDVRQALFGDPEWLGIWERFGRVETTRLVDSSRSERRAISALLLDLEVAQVYDTNPIATPLDEVAVDVRPIDPATGLPRPSTQVSKTIEVPQ